MPDEMTDEVVDGDEGKEFKWGTFDFEREEEVLEMDLLKEVKDNDEEMDDVANVEVIEEPGILNTCEGPIDIEVVDVDDVDPSPMVDSERHVHFESNLAEAFIRPHENSMKGLAVEKEDGRTRPKLGTTLGRGSRREGVSRV